MENRLESLRNKIDELILNGNPDRSYDKICMYISHMYGVAHSCTLLALRRGLDAELAASCGMLHDIYYMTGGSVDNHAANGAKLAEEILKSMGEYSKDEIGIITAAIFNHSDKLAVHNAYDEILKDADVLNHCLYNVSFPVIEKEVSRYKSILKELGVQGG